MTKFKPLSFIRPEFLAGAGLGLSSLTALRFGDFPVGLSEILFFLSFVGLMFSGAIRLFNPIGLFWILSFSILSIGFFFSVVGSNFDQYAIAQDAMSLVFAYMISAAIFSISIDRARRALFVSSFAFVSVFVFGVILLAALVFGVGWETGARLYGLSKNPNQLAFFCLIAVLASGAYWQLNEGLLLGYFVSGLLALLALFVGYYSASDAFVFSIFSFFASYVSLMFLMAPVRGYWFAVVKLFIFLCVFMCLIFLALYPDVLINYFEEVAYDGEQGGVRFALWSNGVDAVFLSPIWGWGPGAWSGLSAPLQGAEAHNTYIDWATKTGVVGLVSFVALNVVVLYRQLMLRNIFFVSCLISVIIFSVFHLIVRQPGYWFVISYCLALSFASGKSFVADRRVVVE